MSVEIKEVVSKKDIKTFVNLPFQIYKNNKYWVPPIKKDEIKALMPEHNPAFEFCDARFFLAYKNGKCLGRVGAIVNKAYNEKVGKKSGRINRLEFFDDFEVTEALISKVLEWFKELKLEFVHGPLGFTNLDTQGMMIEGFDYLPSIASVYHLPYYQTHMDKLGFEKENDWIEFRLTITENALKKGARGSELIKKRFGFEVVNFSNKEEMKTYSNAMFDILNDAFDELPYVTKMTPKMRELYIKKYFDVLNPRFVKVVKKDDKPVGFFVGAPSLSKAMQKAKGKLFPFGFKHLLKAIKNPEVIDMMLTGVLHEYHSAGVAVILISELQQEMHKSGLNIMETTGVFETNHNVISNWKNYEHEQYKRRRCYVKSI